MREKPPASLSVECDAIPQFSGKTLGDLYDFVIADLLPLYADCASRHRALQKWADGTDTP